MVTDTVSYKWSGTRKATCGALLLGYQSNQWFILGMHAAGQPSGGQGFSIYLGDRNYNAVLENVEKQGVDLNAYFSINHYEDPVFPELCSYEDDQHKILAQTSPYSPTNLVRTPYDASGEYPFAPAHIGKLSYEKALAKEKSAYHIDRPGFIFLEILRTYKDLILEKAMPEWKVRIPTNLTRSPVVAVLDAKDGNEPFCKKSARGLRLQYLGIKKDTIFDPLSIERQQFIGYVEEYWRHADKTREFSSQLNHDKQKPEVRDIARVLEKKTRVFNVTDFFDNVMIRQAIGPIMAIYPVDSVTGPASCGIDPRSLAWSMIAKKFEKFGKVCAMDVSGFEYIVILVLINLLDPVFCHAFPKWSDRLAAKWALVSIICAKRYAFGVGRILWRANTSGNFATTFLNTIECVAYFACSTIILSILNNDDPNHCLTIMRIQAYSDDNISALERSWWTENNLSIIFMKHFGIMLTNTDKSEVTGVVTNTIHTIDFLGRTFRYENGTYFAPLDLGRLLAQLYYVKVPKNEKYNFQYVLQQLQINVDNVCSELAEYSVEDANRIRDDIGAKLRAMNTFVALGDTPLSSYRKVCNY
jgi:hypothetical protein